MYFIKGRRILKAAKTPVVLLTYVFVQSKQTELLWLAPTVEPLHVKQS